jgi:UDP-glucose 4-epimerase
MKKTILVTGGAGYIGAHFVNKLIEKDDAEVIVVDNFSQSKNNVIKSSNVSYYQVDIRDKQKLLDIFKKNSVDVVVHFAALANVPDSVSRPKNYYDNNINGGLSLLSCMLETGVKKIVFSSSAAVYGEPVSEIITEDHPTKPINPYGYTKLIFENILKDYQRAYDIDSISFRYFCAAGCDESLRVGEYHNPETHVIPCIVETLLGKRDEFFVYGDDYSTSDGTGVRDYIHVNDIVGAHINAMERLLGSNNLCEAYNLGINKGFSVMELIGAAERVSGKKLNYKVAPKRQGDPARLIADSSRAQQELGWKPRYIDIDEIILSAFNFFKKIT